MTFNDRPVYGGFFLFQRRYRLVSISTESLWPAYGIIFGFMFKVFFVDIEKFEIFGQQCNFLAKFKRDWLIVIKHYCVLSIDQVGKSYFQMILMMKTLTILFWRNIVKMLYVQRLQKNQKEKKWTGNYWYLLNPSYII